MSRLFSFDMDGTLLPTTTGLLELAKQLGTERELQVLESQFRAGTLNTVAFTKEISRLWGPISDVDAEAAFRNAPKIDGISEVVELIREAGAVSCVVTVSQDIFANNFKDLGFNHVFATPYPPHNDNDFTQVLEPEDKVKLLKELAYSHEFDFSSTVAFGDSISDVPLFSELGVSVAINGDHHVSACASYSYRGVNIKEAFLKSKHLWEMK